MTTDHDHSNVDGTVSSAVTELVEDLNDQYRDDDFDPALDEEMAAEYGQPSPPAWASKRLWPGEMALAPRRPESLDKDSLAAWWHDLKSWSTWAIRTFRLSRTFPPCWPQHPALVEELMALWLAWQSAWLPAKEPTGPAQFLQLLDFSVARCARLWQVPCDPAGPHKTPPSVVVGADGQPDLTRWWGNDNYNTQGARP